MFIIVLSYAYYYPIKPTVCLLELINDHNLFLPRQWFRLKFFSDPKTKDFQTKIISDKTFQTEIKHDQIFQTQFTSDQISKTQGVSDQTSQTEGVLIRPSSDHCPDSISDHFPKFNKTMIRLKYARRSCGQTQLRLQPFTIRLKRARNRF